MSKIQLNARNRTYEFEAGAGRRLLYEGLAAGVRLPYECATGTCGTCKARVTAGEVVDLWREAPGRKYLKQPGEILLCQCEARGDVNLEVGNFVYHMDPGACLPATRRGLIGNMKTLTHDVISFSVKLDAPMDFDAGQYAAVQVPGIPGYRGYSMVNFERGAKQLDFVVKKKPGGGASGWLFEGGIDGKPVDVFGPLGSATFYPNIAKNLLLIAGGSGIAGMMSILARASQEHYFDQYRGHVFFGVRTMKDTFYLDELAAFCAAFAQNLEIVIALSDEAVPAEATKSHPQLQFEHGFVHEVAQRRMKGRYQNMRAYVAGPPPAVDASLRLLLLEAKLTADNIRYDKFS